MIWALLLSAAAFAHNGAHPDNPDVMNARGGVIKETATMHVEAVPAKKSAQFYFYDRKMKPIQVAKVHAKARVASQQTSLNLVLEPKGDHFDAPYPREPLRRYQLIVVVSDKTDEVVIFDIDPTKIKNP